MGQQSSRRSAAEACECGGWERRPRAAPGHVQRYVAAVTDRWSGECGCRRGRRAPCVCTAYRRVSDARAAEHEREREREPERADERLAAVITLGARELRRELDTLVINTADGAAPREDADPLNAEVYLLSVAPRPQSGESTTEIGTSDLSQNTSPLRLTSHIQVVCSSDVRALLLRTPNTAPARVHTQVDYIHCLVPDLEQITACAFYWGKMDRYEAERLLDNKPEGTFLLRDSAQEEHLFSVSFRRYGRSLHARIEHYRRRFSFDSHDPCVYSAATVTELIDHYKDPACVMFFEPMLTAPLPRAQPFSLQQLARAAIVSHVTYDDVDLLPLPRRLLRYLQEYHYRQRVRERRLEHYRVLDVARVA